VVACLQALRLAMPTAKIETTSLMLIKELLLSGRDWLAVVPRDMFRAELHARRLQIFGKDSEALLQPMGVAYRRRASGAEVSHVAQFIDCLREVSAAGEFRNG
jgi:DNA-binding transcriptional LysR family regulator